MAEFPITEHLKTLLAASGATTGYQLEIGVMPDKPNRVIALNDTGGLEPNPKWALDFPSAQALIRGRANDYLGVWRMGKVVKDVLLGITSQDMANGDRLVSIRLLGDLGFIGRDQEMRPTFAVNFTLITQPQIVPNMKRIALA